MGATSGTCLAMVEDSDEDFAAYLRVIDAHDARAIERWRSGEAALSALRRRDVSTLVLLTVDLHLPGIDGFAVIEQVRSLPGGQTPAICMLCGSGDEADRDRALEAGADGYIVKPDDLAGLRLLPDQIRALLDRVAEARAWPDQ